MTTRAGSLTSAVESPIPEQSNLEPSKLEPWMRGYLSDHHPILAAVLYALQQAREAVSVRTEALAHEQLWRETGNIAPVGFHIRHIAGSVDRLITYAVGKSLSEDQMTALNEEKE